MSCHTGPQQQRPYLPTLTSFCLTPHQPHFLAVPVLRQGVRQDRQTLPVWQAGPRNLLVQRGLEERRTPGPQKSTSSRQGVSDGRARP